MTSGYRNNNRSNITGYCVTWKKKVSATTQHKWCIDIYDGHTMNAKQVKNPALWATIIGMQFKML